MPTGRAARREHFLVRLVLGVLLVLSGVPFRGRLAIRMEAGEEIIYGQRSCEHVHADYGWPVPLTKVDPSVKTDVIRVVSIAAEQRCPVLKPT